MQQTEPKMNNIQYLWDFPGGPVVKNLPRRAGDTGSIQCQGSKIPGALEQLSLCAATGESTHQGRSAHLSEDPVQLNK